MRWGGRRHCPRCKFSRKLYSISDGRFQCSRCSFKFKEFTGTYLEGIRIPFDELAHLLYLFVLGVPSYRSRGYLSVSLKTAQRVYILFRQALYNHCMQQIKTIVMDGEIEMDETIFGGGVSRKRGWGAVVKRMVFGIYQRS